MVDLTCFCRKTEQLNKHETQRGADRAELLRNLKVREREIESMMGAIQGLAHDMWLRIESEAKLMWSGLSEYRSGFKSARVLIYFLHHFSCCMSPWKVSSMCTHVRVVHILVVYSCASRMRIHERAQCDHTRAYV